VKPEKLYFCIQKLRTDLLNYWQQILMMANQQVNYKNKNKNAVGRGYDWSSLICKATQKITKIKSKLQRSFFDEIKAQQSKLKPKTPITRLDKILIDAKSWLHRLKIGYQVVIKNNEFTSGQMFVENLGTTCPEQDLRKITLGYTTCANIEKFGYTDFTKYFTRLITGLKKKLFFDFKPTQIFSNLLLKHLLTKPLLTVLDYCVYRISSGAM